MEWQWVGLNGIGLDRYINIIIVIEELVRFASFTCIPCFLDQSKFCDESRAFLTLTTCLD
jgi:hypothetical protein